MALIKNQQINAGKEVDNSQPCYSVGRNANLYGDRNRELQCKPSRSLLRMCKTQSLCLTKIFKMFIEEKFTVPNLQRKHECLTIKEYLKNVIT